MLSKNFAGILILIVLIGISGGNTLAARQTFDEFCLEILDSIQSFYPVKSTEMGIHSYDHRLTDYSSNAVNKMMKNLDEYEKKLYKYRNAEMSLSQKINYKLVKSNVDIALLNLKQIAWHKKSPQLYAEEAINGIYFLMLSQHAPLSEKILSLISRMKAVPDFFAVARKNIKNPPPIYIASATTALEGAIEFYHEVASELMNKFPERADEILKVSTQAREAMGDFINFLATVKTGDEKSFAIGKTNFDYKLSHEYFLDFDADSLLKIGENLLEEALVAYEEYELYVETDHQNGKDSVFVPASFTRQDILDYYNWETEQEKIFLEVNDIITIPEDIAPLEVIETPPYLRSMVNSIAYQPAGPFDQVQKGYFYVRSIPDDLDSRQLAARYRYVHRRGFRGSVVHEAYPGHHLQLQLASRHEDPVRKWQFNTMFIEGWALYCEEMMYSAGLYGSEDPTQWLGILGGIKFRAARIVADVKLHTGQFTPQECIDWMIEVLDVGTESGKEYIKNEVRSYTHEPTYRMSYLMGKREIQRLRDAAMERDGDSFSDKEFNDALLAEGSIPLALMWEIMGLK
ncbi:MAG: DUF885 domain-containing protein [candidate division Zixibacteria bacterium]|nr:DUF885 domain-containing protein [candidate division Zixibacteria bacterium]